MSKHELRLEKGKHTSLIEPSGESAMTPDEQAVERVARALRVRSTGFDDYSRLSKRSKDAYREDARAAIAALAQPKVGDGEVARMVEKLRTYVPSDEICEKAADLLERLTSP